MTIQIQTLDMPPWKVATLKGRIDAFNDKRVLGVLRQILGENTIHLAVDLSRVDFIGFNALQELLRLSEELKSRAGDLVLVGPTAQVRRHLDSFAGHRGLRIFVDHEELRCGLFLKPRAEYAQQHEYQI